MSFFVSIVAIAIIMMVFTSSSAEMKYPKVKSGARGLFSSKHQHKTVKKSLRSRVAVKESPIVKMYGYYEAVVYTNGDCTDALYKGLLAPNICALSADPTHAGEYTLATVLAYPVENYYEIDIQYYSDSACTTVTGSDSLTAPILICDESELDHMITSPLSPTGDNLDFSLFLYNTQANCATNNYQVGVTEAIYSKFNICFEGDASSGLTDTMVMSCSSTELVMNSYTSSDGSCSGTVTVETLNSSNTCTSGDETLLDNYFGYRTFGCAAST